MSEPETISPPADTMRERVGDSRAKTWFLVEGNRWYVAGLFLSVTFVVLVFAGVFLSGDLGGLITKSTIESLFQTIFLTVVTSVVLTLTIGQLILSEEMGDLGEQRARMADEIQFRGHVEETVNIGVSPSTPAAFLRALLRGVEDKTESVRKRAADEPNTEAATQITEFVDVVTDHSNRIERELRNAQFGSFDVLSAVLDFNYSWKARTARRLRDKHADAISERTDETLEELTQNLQLFGPARQYFKLLYYQHELIDVSRVLLYTAMPALGLTAYMGFAFDMQRFTGTVLGVNATFLFISLMAVLSLFPFALLLAFILRMITVSQRTLTIGPFILRSLEESVDLNEL